MERLNPSPQAEVKGRDKAGKRTPDVPRHHPTRQRLLPHESPSAQPANHLAWRWRQTAKGMVEHPTLLQGPKAPTGVDSWAMAKFHQRPTEIFRGLY